MSMFCRMFFVFSKNNFVQLFFFINLIVVFHLTVNCYCFCTTESHICMIALTSVFFFFLTTFGSWKSSGGWWLENKDLDIKSEEIEEGAFENNNLWAEILKQSLQRLGKGLVNGEYFVSASVEMLVLLYDLIRNRTWTIYSKT